MKWILICVVGTLLSCSSSDLDKVLDIDKEKQEEVTTSIFSDSISEYELHIFYEPGAEPYTGNVGLSGNDTWDIMKESVAAAFSTHPSRNTVIPSSLQDMNSISEQSKTEWTFDELKDLGDSITPTLNVADKINMALIFVNGNYQGNNSILGVHLSGTHYAFVFKDVVVSVGGDGATQRYVEQATAVHELGHALGLVNNGLPMNTPHEDTEHSGHTLNEDGVMYWAVESSNSVLDQLLGAISGGQLNLFGPESLADARAHHP